MARDTILITPEFDSRLPWYWTLGGVVPLLFTVVLIPIIPIYLAIAIPLNRARYQKLECELTERSLNIRRGVLTRVEKNIPLDKIQDVAMKEGPILRWLGLAALSVETAGQSTPGGADASLVGVVDARAFRDAVLVQRDVIVGGPASSASSAPAASGIGGGDESVLVEIRDSLQRIERLLAERS